jgi:hypothetical protein
MNFFAQAAAAAPIDFTPAIAAGQTQFYTILSQFSGWIFGVLAIAIAVAVGSMILRGFTKG